MKFLIVVTFLAFIPICNAKVDLKIYYEKTERGYNIFADNKEVCPVSVKVDFDTKNLNIIDGNNNTYIINASTQRQLLTKLLIVDKSKAYKFSYRFLTNYGNHNLKSYDKNYIYNLPFKKSKTHLVYQGYNGNFSHKNENAIDFIMSIGTEIAAIREGIVVKVVDENNKRCEKEECKKFNNFIIVFHPDGTFAEYTHLKFNGSLVNVGDNVNKGQTIGYSGNVGWSTGPHLHLVVFLQKLNDRETLKTMFRTGNADKVEYLVEGTEYSRNY